MLLRPLKNPVFAIKGIEDLKQIVASTLKSEENDGKFCQKQTFGLASKACYLQWFPFFFHSIIVCYWKYGLWVVGMLYFPTGRQHGWQTAYFRSLTM